MITLKDLLQKLDENGSQKLQTLLVHWLSDKMDKYKDIKDLWMLNLRDLPMDFRQQLTELPMSPQLKTSLQQAIDPMVYIAKLEDEVGQLKQELLKQELLKLNQLVKVIQSRETPERKPKTPKTPGNFF